MEQLNIRGIPYGFINPSPISVEDQVRYVVIDLISTVSRMKENCQTLINLKRNCRKDCLKKGRYDCYTDIVYISLLKGFEKEEIVNATKRKIKENYRLIENKIKKGNNIVFLWNKNTEIDELNFHTIKKDMENIFSKAGIME